MSIKKNVNELHLIHWKSISCFVILLGYLKLKVYADEMKNRIKHEITQIWYFFYQTRILKTICYIHLCHKNMRVAI